MDKKAVLLGLLVVFCLCVLSAMADSNRAFRDEQATYVATYGVTATDESIEINLFPENTPTIQPTATKPVVVPSAKPTATATVRPTQTATATVSVEHPMIWDVISWDLMKPSGDYIYCDIREPVFLFWPNGMLSSDGVIKEAHNACVPGTLVDPTLRTVRYTGHQQGVNAPVNGEIYAIPDIDGGYTFFPIESLIVGEQYRICRTDLHAPKVFDGDKDATFYIFDANHDCVSALYRGELTENRTDWLIWQRGDYHEYVIQLDGAYGMEQK